MSGRTPIPGRAPSGRAPGWVPGAHKSRPEAQSRRGKRSGERGAYRGDTENGAHSKESVPQYRTRALWGNAVRVGGTTIFHERPAQEVIMVSLPPNHNIPPLSLFSPGKYPFQSPSCSRCRNCVH